MGIRVGTLTVMRQSRQPIHFCSSQVIPFVSDPTSRPAAPAVPLLPMYFVSYCQFRTGHGDPDKEYPQQNQTALLWGIASIAWLLRLGHHSRDCPVTYVRVGYQIAYRHEIDSCLSAGTVLQSNKSTSFSAARATPVQSRYLY
jgi:hypothetical protein